MSTVKYDKCTVTTTAWWLDVSRETVYNWIRKGDISYIVDENGVQTKYLLATDLDKIRHERVVAAGKELDRLQRVARLV